MRLIFSIILILSILYTSCSSNMRSTEIDWKELSSLNEINGKPSLGYAGPVTGIINNHLIIGGGANFPIVCPGWVVKKIILMLHYFWFLQVIL